MQVKEITAELTCWIIDADDCSHTYEALTSEQTGKQKHKARLINLVSRKEIITLL
jgi:hypothetical protein